jgi:hypothetical protein
MKRRFLLFLLILILLLPCAAAKENMFSYVPQKGVEYHMLGDGTVFEAPEGLEALYRLFAYGDSNASVCVFRMPNGRALASVSCFPLSQPLTAQELYDAKDEIARRFALAMGDDLAAAPDFRTEELWGQQVLSADVMLLGDSNMPLTAKTALLCREDELVEVWWAHPSKLAYAFDPAAEKELKADLKTLQALVDSFLFDMEAPQAVPHMNIAADNGLFSISAPLDTIVITPETDQAAVSRAKSRFAGLTGGSECFDIWYLDVTETNRWLLLSPEHGLAAEVSVCTDEAFDGVAMDDLADRGADLLAQLSNQYDHAAMSAETEKVMLDGMPHWWNTYDLEHAGMELLCYAFTTVQDGTFYELTIFLATNTGKDVEEMSDAILLMMDTIDYLPGR